MLRILSSNMAAIVVKYVNKTHIYINIYNFISFISFLNVGSCPPSQTLLYFDCLNTFLKLKKNHTSLRICTFCN